MRLLAFSGLLLLSVSFAPRVFSNEFRLGGHVSYINPKDSDFSEEYGYGGTMKYKFTDTLGMEIGLDYFRWKLDDVSIMPFDIAPGPVSYREVDRIYPIYFTAMICSPILEQDARAYLGLGGGYYEADADIDGNFNVNEGGRVYPFTVTGDVSGQWSVHAAVGADFQLSSHIYLNAEVRYVLVDLNRKLTASNPEKGSVTVKDEVKFDNWQIRLGLEYSF